MIDSVEGDRRRKPRHLIERPCKVYVNALDLYYPGTTVDLSSDSVLVKIPQVVELKAGDKVHVGIAMTRRHGLLAAKDMIESAVVRVMHTADDHTNVALQFEQAVEAEAPALRLAA